MDKIETLYVTVQINRWYVDSTLTHLYLSTAATMEQEMGIDELIALAQGKIDLGKQLIKELDQIDQVDGVKKVQRKINQEINCLLNVGFCVKIS